MPYATVDDALFNREVTLRDAYRIMERFLSNYLSRGDTVVSDFLHTMPGRSLRAKARILRRSMISWLRLRTSSTNAECICEHNCWV
jgi:hypothetical protein